METAPAETSKNRRTTRIALLAALLLGVLGLGYHLADVLNPFLIALLIAYVLNPVVEMLERHRVRRRFTVAVLFAVVLAGGVMGVGFGAFSATDHLDDIRWELAGERPLDDKVPADHERIAALVAHKDPTLRRLEDGRYYVDEDLSGMRKVGLIEKITATLGPKLKSIPSVWVEGATRALETQAGEALTVGVQASRGLQTFLGHIWNVVGYVFLVPIYSFFLLLSLSDIRNDVARHLPGRYRERILVIARRLDVALAAFFRGRLLLALGKGLLTWLGLWMVGVRFSFFLGMVAGVLSVVPFLGTIVGGLLAVAFAYEPTGWAARCVGVAITFLATESLEAAVFPFLIGRNVGLHPVALILSVFCFGKLFGLFGVLLAVPIACVVKIAFLELVMPEVRALAAEPPDPVPARSEPPR